MRFAATPEDFLKGRLLTPGYYPTQIVGYEEKMSKGGWDEKTQTQKEPSMYIEMKFKVVTGEFAGTILFTNFSEKAPTLIVPLLEALGATIDKKKAFNFEPSADKFHNKYVNVHVIRGSYNGKPKNEIDGFAKYTGPAVPAAPAQAGV